MMMPRSAVASLLAIAAVLSVGHASCKGEEEESGEITASQSQAIWSSTSTALDEVEQGLVPDIQRKDRDSRDGGLLPDRRDGGSGWLTGAITSFQVNGTVDNPQGSGTATITGTGGRQGSTWVVDLTITFNDWEAAGMVINGPLALSYTLTSLSPLAMTLTVEGTLQVTVGKLPLPAKVVVKVEVAGGVTTVCGTVAGNPVGEGSCP